MFILYKCIKILKYNNFLEKKKTFVKICFHISKKELGKIYINYESLNAKQHIHSCTHYLLIIHIIKIAMYLFYISY